MISVSSNIENYDDNRPEEQEDYNPMISRKKEKEFNKLSKEIETYWDIGINAAEEVDNRINRLVAILHEDHPDWSFKKIAYTLAIKFEHLPGFSQSTIRRNLDQTNLQLIDDSKNSYRTKLQNDVLSHDSTVFSNKDIEDSSINDNDSGTTTKLETEYNVVDAETKGLDNDDDDDNDEVIAPRIIQFKYNLEIKGEIFPVIATTYVETGTGKVELDEKELRRLYKKR